MTEEEYELLKIRLRRGSYLKGRITAAKKMVARWTRVESSLLSAGKDTEKVRKRVLICINTLETIRKQFAEL